MLGEPTHFADCMESNRLLISNVPAECSGKDLTQWLEGLGYTVNSVSLVRDKISGSSPSFAHVELSDRRYLKEAIRALNGRPLRGRKVSVGALAF
jgi:RNA recognition motif-containing protein